MPAKEKQKTKAIEKKIPGEIEINLENIRKYVAPTGTVKECEEFLNICAIWKLNPFKREIYFIKYDPKRAPTTVVGYEVYLKRAERQKKLKGWKAWTEPCKTIKGEDSMKACIQIHRADWDEPFFHEIYWEEFAQYKYDYRANKRVLTKFWKEKPRFMLEKVVIGQGFRMCFPDDMGGMPYTSEEMPVEHEKLPREVIEAEKADKKAEEKPKPEAKEKPEPKPKSKPKPKKKATLETAKSKDLKGAKQPQIPLPEPPPGLIEKDEPKEGISKEEYEKQKKNATPEAIDLDDSEEDKDGAKGVALDNAIEQKLNLLDNHYKRNRVKLIEKIHNVLGEKFGISVAKFPQDLDEETKKYALEVLNVTIENEEKKRSG